MGERLKGIHQFQSYSLVITWSHSEFADHTVALKADWLYKIKSPVVYFYTNIVDGVVLSTCMNKVSLLCG